MQTIIKTLNFEDGELYSIVDSRRILLAGCSLKAELRETSTTVQILGERKAQIKKIDIVLLLCGDFEFTRDVDEKYLKMVSRFEAVGTIQRMDGVFEKISFNNISPDIINLDGTWQFEARVTDDMLNKLKAL